MSGISWRRLCLAVAGGAGATAIGLGAYAAHGTGGQAAEWIDKASRYQLLHAVALLVLAGCEGRLAKLAGALFIAGIILFGGGLDAMALADSPVVAVVPIGGTAFILGWLAIFAGALGDTGIALKRD